MRLIQEALTFDDVLLEPAYSEVLPREVSLRTRLTAEISLELPIVSAAMDTVTEARLAIALAQEGGIGVIHKNMTAEAQAREVRRVKKYESGIVNDPITVGPDKTIRKCSTSRGRAAFRACRWCRASASWASSPTATCASRPASTCGVGGHDAA
jgi:IMP dehydrogenase/GMP reductase